ncbi:hypothetical protein L484_014677 [Morus notabilis]|uniref:Uncharacterized protein n=1 Tax=Morus notabilis TaxID=981085 RepID=W9T013_9ROSA|nr:hypothetical protein L484_014677 [Morus notabilis]
MGRKKKYLACLSLLLLMLLHFESNARFAEGYIGKYSGRFRRSAMSFKSHDQLNPLKSQPKGGSFKGNFNAKDGDEVFGVEKRKIYTGPNPLHNR